MSLYGVGSAASDRTVAANQYTPKNDTTKQSDKVAQKDDKAAVYEKGTFDSEAAQKTNRDIIEKMKSEAEQRNNQLRSLVEKMFNKQGKAFKDAEMFQLLRTGNFDVDLETKNKAIQDISEDGYYGVKETSNRLVSFAKALSNSDPAKADKMIEAVKKGFEAAKKAWGGELPEICQKTVDETIKQLEDWKKSTSAQTK